MVTAVSPFAAPLSAPPCCACPVASAACPGCARCCCSRRLCLSAPVLGFAPEVMPPYWATPLPFVSVPRVCRCCLFYYLYESRTRSPLTPLAVCSAGDPGEWRGWYAHLPLSQPLLTLRFWTKTSRATVIPNGHHFGYNRTITDRLGSGMCIGGRSYTGCRRHGQGSKIASANSHSAPQQQVLAVQARGKQLGVPEPLGSSVYIVRMARRVCVQSQSASLGFLGRRRRHSCSSGWRLAIQASHATSTLAARAWASSRSKTSSVHRGLLRLRRRGRGCGRRRH